MLLVKYLDALTHRTVREAKFKTEEDFLNDFFQYVGIRNESRWSWTGCTDSLYLDEDDPDHADRLACDLGHDRWLNVELV